MKLVLGTRNRKKLQEMVELLQDLPLQLADLTQFAHVREVVEDGATFEENARKKATELASALRQYVLAEDSGLVVPALNDEPGVRSARYAGEHGDDDANNALLLQKLAAVPDEPVARVSDPGRSAFYVCVAVLSDPEGNVLATGEGRCHGRITHELRGTSGFGYDPLFLIPEYHRTFGELSARVKHALSHRARALLQLRPTLRQLS